MSRTLSLRHIGPSSRLTSVISGVVKKLVDKMPIDTTVLDERIQYGLCMGDVATVSLTILTDEFSS